MRKWIVAIMLVLIAVVPSSAEPGYTAGVLVGTQALIYPFLDGLEGWNNDSRLAFYGVYGYGITDGGMIAGGFGSWIDAGKESNVGGAVGGFILGKQYVAKPVSISLTSWTGFGPVSTNWGAQDFQIDGETGFICFMEEVTLEVGLPLFHWFMPTAYVGVQAMGNVHEWDNFNSFASYTAVVGIRIQFGKFSYVMFET